MNNKPPSSTGMGLSATLAEANDTPTGPSCQLYTSTDLAEGHPFDGEQIVRVDGRTVLYRGKDILDALRFVLT